MLLSRTAQRCRGLRGAIGIWNHGSLGRCASFSDAKKSAFELHQNAPRQNKKGNSEAEAEGFTYRLPDGHKSQGQHVLPACALTFLGTGASHPSRFKSSSCSILDLGVDKLIFDAGEGSLRQSIRSGHSIVSGNHIFITHMHGDHVLGLPSIILAHGNVPHALQDLNIYGPPGLHHYLCTVLEMVQGRVDRKVIVNELKISEKEFSGLRQASNHSKNSRKTWPWKKDWKEYQSPPLREKDFIGEDGVILIEKKEIVPDQNGTWTCMDNCTFKLQARLIAHKIPCFGYVFEEMPVVGSLRIDEVQKRGIPFSPGGYKNIKAGYDTIFPDGKVVPASELLGPSTAGRKITILGDTENANNIASLAKDSDIVVHESTFNDASAEQASKAGHATTKVAANFLLNTQSKRLVVNHIGTQYIQNQGEHKPSLDKYPDIKFDTHLQEDVRRAAGRPEHCIIARDYMSVSVPVGGYNLTDDRFQVSFSNPDVDAPPYVVTSLTPVGTPYKNTDHNEVASLFSRINTRNWRMGLKGDPRGSPSPLRTAMKNLHGDKMPESLRRNSGATQTKN